MINTLALHEVLCACRTLRRRAIVGRHFAKVVKETFRQFTAALDHLHRAAQSVGAEETARMIVRDFVAAHRFDEEAQAALRDWITDALLAAIAETEAKNEQLYLAAQSVIENSDRFDLLPDAIRHLAEVLGVPVFEEADATTDEAIESIEVTA
jgi:hypothetical protein